MRKLILMASLLFWVANSLLAERLIPTNLTYSIEADPFATEFGNNFAYYHINLNIENLTRVARNGNIRVVINFKKGLVVKDNKAVNLPNGIAYYLTKVSLPRYEAIITDEVGKKLFEKTYGGAAQELAFGEGRNFSERDLAIMWENEKNSHFQKEEFRSLDFTALENDIASIIQTQIIGVNFVDSTNSTPKQQPTKVIDSSPSTTPIKPKKENIEKPETEMSKPIEPMEEADEPLIKQDKIRTDKPINVEAAEAEEAILKDPFGELNEPLADEKLAESGKDAPAAPIDYEEKAKQEPIKRAKNSKKKVAKADKITPALSDRINIIKLNLPNLAIGNLTINYERLLSARNSMSLNLGYIRPQKPTSLLTDFLDTDEVEPGEFSGITATVDYRIYNKKKGAGKGFYIAPYVRYANHKLAFSSDIEGNPTNVASKLSTVGIGGQIGIQWLIKDRVAIDWGILGVAVQWYNFSSTFTASGETEIDFDEIQAELEMSVEESILSNKLEFTTKEESLEAKMPFLFGGTRAYFSVGYKF